MDKVERSIYFYKIRIKKHGKLVDPKTVFTFLDKLPFSVKGRYLKSEDGHSLSIRIDKKEYPISSRLGTTRYKALPQVDKRGEIYPLKIADDEGLVESTHFIIFPNQVIGSEYNYHGPRISTLKWYLSKKCEEEDLFDEIELLPLLRRDIGELINRIGGVKFCDLRIQRDMTELMKEVHGDLKSALEAQKNITDEDVKELGVYLSAGPGYTRPGIGIKFLDKLLDFIKEKGPEGINRLQVKARNNITGKIEEFDILKPAIISKKKVAKHDEKHRHVDSDSMYKAIKEAYADLEDEINKILG